jgi:hydroxymethylpyrimidine pyrophosphatase-like HAD family hydrolase
MGNALPAVKKIATRVTGSNEADGVAIELEKLIADGYHL